LTFTLVSTGSLGTATLTDALTGSYTYTPNPNATGTDTFSFMVNDGTVDSNVAAVTVTIIVVDTDGDGISDDDETNLYGTDPNMADTDGDGIIDGDELAFWGNDWDADYDGDGVINLVDWDSDGDGFSDGFETAQGYDPSDPDSTPPLVEVWFEAEAGYLNAPMEVALDAMASDGEYIWVPGGYGKVLDPSQEAGYAEYNFEVAESGEYVIWGRVISNSSDEDSFFVSMDGGAYVEWHTAQGGEEVWVWDQVRNGAGNPEPVIFYLEAGQHSLVIKQREDGTKLDKILITNDLAYIPEGLGNVAPVAFDTTITTTEDTMVSGTLQASDVNGDALTFNLVSTGSLGTATLTDATTGAYTYTPDPNTTGTDTFSFMVNDGMADSNVATVTVTITAEEVTNIAYEVPAGTMGNQSWTGALGMDFVVNQTIEVTALGVFDSGGDGLTGPLTVQLWDRNDTSSPLGEIVFPAGTPGTLLGGIRFMNLSTPLLLWPGFDGAIVAYGFNGDDENYNSNGGDSLVATNDGGGALSFFGWRYANDTSFPNITGPDPDRFGAGTFRYRVVP
jgi:hypothetical protein